VNHKEKVRFLSELFQKTGIGKGTERYSICKHALGYLGYSYERHEELVFSETIDCSTLVSQSHWEGALIGVPFTAESQRKASSGKVISSMAEALPADVLVKYPSVSESPDGQWNHVGLYLGRDTSGIEWVVESVSGAGVRLTRAADFDPQGGIRRFVPFEDVVHDSTARAALALAIRVPKLGRLGAKQYPVSGGFRQAHRGVDIYTKENMPVYAGMEGVISVLHDNLKKTDGVEIYSQEETAARYLMLRDIRVHDGDIVKVGALIGYVRRPPKNSGLVYSKLFGDTAHLHLEFQTRRGSSYAQGNCHVEGDSVYLNPLYCSKFGQLSLPFRRT